LDAGVRIIAQTNLAKRALPVPGATQSARSSIVTFDSEYTVRGGGIEVRLLHFGRAQSDADTIVYFPDHKVVAVGELYSATKPWVDLENGGSLVGWGAVLAEILKLDFDVVVPARGPIASRTDLENFKTIIDSLVRGGSALVKGAAANDDLMQRTGR
jgi:cyclase